MWICTAPLTLSSKYHCNIDQYIALFFFTFWLLMCVISVSLPSLQSEKIGKQSPVEETQICPTCRIKTLRILFWNAYFIWEDFSSRTELHTFVVCKQWDRPKARHLFLSSLYSCITLFHITSGYCGLKLPGTLAKFLSLQSHHFMQATFSYKIFLSTRQLFQSVVFASLDTGRRTETVAKLVWGQGPQDLVEKVS